MSINQHATLLLVGAGPMAIEYAKVLQKLKKKFIIIGRGELSAQDFQQKTGLLPITGGLHKFLSSNSLPIKQAIIAVSEDQLGITAIELLRYGIKTILVEKPGGASFSEIEKVEREAKNRKAKVFVAYNRRFYSSIKKALQIIKKDHGVLSFNFEFTELSERIAPLIKATGVKENWFLHNSTHVIDLAFFIAGQPKHLCSFTTGGLPWHPKASIFSGAGTTVKGALFSYQANWDAPGRWVLEVLTKNYRLIFKPLEELQVQNKGSFEINRVEIDNQFDKNFKPGLYKEVISFLTNNKDLCTLEEQCTNLALYKKMLQGSTNVK